MEFLIPIAALLQMDEIYENFRDVADDDGSYDVCAWCYCNFNNPCGSNISQDLELFNFVYMTLGNRCQGESFSCEECDEFLTK